MFIKLSFPGAGIIVGNKFLNGTYCLGKHKKINLNWGYCNEN
jgi:hypothetical protein